MRQTNPFRNHAPLDLISAQRPADAPSLSERNKYGVPGITSAGGRFEKAFLDAWLLGLLDLCVRNSSGSAAEAVLKSQASRLQEAVIAFPIENDVVQERNTDDRTRRLELAGHLDIGWGGLKPAARVVVRDNNGSRAIRQSVSEYLSRVNGSTVDQAN